MTDSLLETTEGVGRMDTTQSTESLVELAARKQLPQYQYTDQATVRWIEANRPDLPVGLVPHLPMTSQALLRRSAVPSAWFAEERTIDSLHGVRHGMRTAALAALLAAATGMDGDETADLIVAAAVHDCRRLHDKDDHAHGDRAASWLTANADVVWAHFGLAATPVRVRRASTAIRLHDVPYGAFTPADEAEAGASLVSDLLKAADALDRYRLPKLSWWPDPAQVRADAFEGLRSTAFDLALRSEVLRLSGTGSAESVFEALRQTALRRTERLS